MTGVRLGGIDPSILRELSGVYKPFVKALKELVSNAFDADAEHVQISIDDDCSSVTVHDDGEGMTPLEFRNDFTRIGGGSRRWLGERTRKGRLRIGSKGIGFLALARYCSHLEENEQYKTLRYHLIGEGEHVAGPLGQAIGAVLRRSQVRSALKDVLGRAMLRRRVLYDVLVRVRAAGVGPWDAKTREGLFGTRSRTVGSWREPTEERSKDRDRRRRVRWKG